MGKLIGYARVSTRGQDTDRQTSDLFAAGVRRDDLYIDHGISGARAARPVLDRALEALHTGDTLVITTLDRSGRSITNMLTLAERLKTKGTNPRSLSLGGGDVDNSTPIGAMFFPPTAAPILVLALALALALMELEIKRERVTDSVVKRRAAGTETGRPAPDPHRRSRPKRPRPHRCRPAGNRRGPRSGHPSIPRATPYRRSAGLEAKERIKAH